MRSVGTLSLSSRAFHFTDDLIVPHSDKACPPQIAVLWGLIVGSARESLKMTFLRLLQSLHQVVSSKRFLCLKLTLLNHASAAAPPSSPPILPVDDDGELSDELIPD